MSDFDQWEQQLEPDGLDMFIATAVDACGDDGNDLANLYRCLKTMLSHLPDAEPT